MAKNVYGVKPDIFKITGNCNFATLVHPTASGRVVLVPQSGNPQSIMDRWTQESSPANESRVSPIEEGVERDVPPLPPGVTVVHLADSEDMLDTSSAQVVQQNPQNSRR